VINYSDVDDNVKLVKEFLTMAKTNWNRNHEILLKGHEVEIYVQDHAEPHHSTGVYSLSQNRWVIKPVKKEFAVSESAVEQKAAAIENLIDMVFDLKIKKKYEEAYGEADRLMDKIRRYRQCGLDQGGEFSTENLVFKTLRHNDYLKKLSDLKKETYDKLMSLTECKKVRDG
jgi:NADH pyrophosphatase NudC (nudix superfamily)